MAGFMTSSCALSVFSVEDLDIKDETQDQVQKYAFSQTMEVPDSDALEGITRSGWVGLGDAQDVDFKFPVFMPPYMAFTLRTDSKKANAKAVKAVLAERIAAEGSPVSRQRKKELKEMVTLEELKKTPWLPTTTDCILDLDKRRLYIASVSESSINEVLHAVRAHLWRTPCGLCLNGNGYGRTVCRSFQAQRDAGQQCLRLCRWLQRGTAGRGRECRGRHVQVHGARGKQ